MEDFKINDYILQKEAESIAKDAIEECGNDLDAIQEHIWQTVDGHQWVIYYYQAIQLCANCNTDEGAQFVEDLGMETGSFEVMATRIAFGELYNRAMQASQEAIDSLDDIEEEVA